MPIEYGNVPWPPAECARPNELYRAWGAWYAGDPEELATVYGNSGGWIGRPDMTPTVRTAQRAGGVVGKIARWFWGSPVTPEQPQQRLHLPAAGDLSMYATDLLFGAEPDIMIGAPVKSTDSTGLVVMTPDPATARWDAIADSTSFFPRMLESGELDSAYGGVYLRVTIPAKINGWLPVEAPIVEAIPPDAAVPEWRNGFLVAVTFWREVAADDKRTVVWRHLERHEPGIVYHALYRGTADRLGEQAPSLDLQPATRGFAPFAKTGASGLAVEYVPNMRPHRLIRGTNLGRSDYSGAEPFMDALDETWSSWMRDIRLAKGRVFIPEAYLESNGPGQGASFDAEREFFTKLSTLPGQDSQGLTMNQFAIRVAEHRDTAAAQLRQIWRTAGYSTGENGEENESQAAATATEVISRGARTAATRKRKIGYWRPALQRLVRTILEMDAAAGFRNAVRIGPDTPIMIEFPPSVAPDPKALAETINLLAQAAAASTRTLVEMAHPDWDETQVEQEVALIEKATAAKAPSDPFGDPNEPDPDDPSNAPPAGS